MLHDDGPECGIRRGDDVPAGARDGDPGVEGPALQRIHLGDAMIVGGLRQLGKELGRGELFRQDVRRCGDARLGHAKGRLHDGRRVDRLGHEIGMGGVETVQVEGLLEIEEQPLDRPAQAIERQRLGGSQAGGRQDVGQQVQATMRAGPR